VAAVVLQLAELLGLLALLELAGVRLLGLLVVGVGVGAAAALSSCGGGGGGGYDKRVAAAVAVERG
jgi:hypothetical protein